MPTSAAWQLAVGTTSSSWPIRSTAGSVRRTPTSIATLPGMAERPNARRVLKTFAMTAGAWASASAEGWVPRSHLVSTRCRARTPRAFGRSMRSSVRIRGSHRAESLPPSIMVDGLRHPLLVVPQAPGVLRLPEPDVVRRSAPSLPITCLRRGLCGLAGRPSARMVLILRSATPTRARTWSSPGARRRFAGAAGADRELVGPYASVRG